MLRVESSPARACCTTRISFDFMKHLLLLGGGPAHLQVLRSLARSGLTAAHVTLVAPFPRTASEHMLAGFVEGRHAADEGSISLTDLAAAASVQFVQAQPTALNASERTVTLADGRVMGYDVLSIDSGPTLNRDRIPGARGLALFVQPVEHFHKLWGGLLLLAAERPLSVVVLGGGRTAVELAMALQLRLHAQACVSLVTAGDPLLPECGEAMRQRVRALLKRRGLTLIEEACTEVTASHVVLRGGGRLVCDAPIAAWASDGPGWLANSGLALDAQGFVLTGATLQSSSHPGVFAVGEVASRMEISAPKHIDAAATAATLSVNLRRHVYTGVLTHHIPRERQLRFLNCADHQAMASWGPWVVEGRWVWAMKNRLDQSQAGHRG